MLAAAATTLTEADLRLFTRVAGLGVPDAEALLLTAERFASVPHDDPALEPEMRRDILDRYGIYGVRLGTALVRHGHATTAPRLAAELRQRSGIDALERLLATRFTARSDTLKARSALLALGDVLRRWPGAPGVATLRGEVERVHASGHELAELRVLVAARAGELTLEPDAIEELERALSSGDACERVGADSDEDLADAVVDQVARWRARAEHPLAPRRSSRRARSWSERSRESSPRRARAQWARPRADDT